VTRSSRGSAVRFALFKAGFALFAALPLPVVHAIATALGRLLGALPLKLRHIARANLRLCFPDRSREERETLMRRSIVEFCKTFLETAVIWGADRQRVLGLINEVHGAQLLDEGLARGKGVILAAPHLGSWELVGQYLSSRHPMTNLYRPPRSRNVERLMRQCRERFGSRIVPTTTHGVRELYKALERNELVGILPDQNPGRGTGVFVPFFGVTTYSPVLLSRLARKTGAAVLFVYAERLPRGTGFHLHFLPAPKGVDSPDLNTAAQRVNEGIEDCVRRLPEQYWWSHNRFRTRPKGEPPIY